MVETHLRLRHTISPSRCYASLNLVLALNCVPYPLALEVGISNTRTLLPVHLCDDKKQAFRITAFKPKKLLLSLDSMYTTTFVTAL